jgi:hypothetical protein
MAARTPEEIRASIEHNRAELGTSLVKLRSEVVALTDWRAQLQRNQPQLTRAAALSGFVLGGGIAALTGLAFGGRRRAEQPAGGRKRRRRG